MSGAAELDGAVVLICDDNESTRYVLARWLRRAGAAVVEAATGAEALRAVRSTMPDVAVLDVNLPDMSGFDVMRHLKDRDPALPVLHVSATAIHVSDRAEGLERGADAYLTEPIDRAELLATATALLRYSSARRAAERLTEQMAALHDGLVELHSAGDVEALATVAALAAARILDRRLAVAVYAEHEGAIALADPGVLLGRAPYRPGALIASAGAGTVAPRGAVEAVAMEEFRPPPELREVLGPLADRTVHGLITRHSRGSGVAGLIVDGTIDGGAEQLLASQIVRSAAVAVDNLRLVEIERTVAHTLQRALLPESAPHVDGLEIATRYIASEAGSEVGGDFYDAFELAPGVAALVIGDVQGHSIEAASVMGDLRAGLRALATSGFSPEQVVERTNDLFIRFSPARTATLCLAVLEIASGRLTVLNAGHIPLVVASPAAVWLLTGGATLLGVRGRRPQPTTFSLPDGSTLLMFTDGLVERRRRSLDEGLGEVVRAARMAPLHDVHTTVSEVLDRCRSRSSDDQDDVAIMVVRRSATATGIAGTEAPVVLGSGQMAVQRFDDASPARGPAG